MEEQKHKDQPTPQEIEQAISELTNTFQTKDRVTIIVENLYKNLILKTIQEMKQKEQLKAKREFFFGKKPGRIAPNKVLNSEQDQICALFVVPLQPIFRNQMDWLLYYQKKIAAQTFIKHGYSLQHCRDQIQRRGGLFDMTEERYKIMATAFVTEAYQRMQKFIEDNSIQIFKLHKVQNIALYSILLNCSNFFTEKETNTFLSFIALLYQEYIETVRISKKDTLLFYQKSKQLVKQKLQKGRGLAQNTSNLGMSLQGAKVVENFSKNRLKASKKSEKDRLQKHLLILYIQYKDIGQTKRAFEKDNGIHSQYESHSQIQSVIFSALRKTLKEIGQYHSKHRLILPPLATINDASIKLILTSKEGTTLRIKILMLSLQFQKQRQIINNHGDQIHKTMWGLQPSLLAQQDLVLLIDLMEQINKYLQLKSHILQQMTGQNRFMNFNYNVGLKSPEDGDNSLMAKKKKIVMKFNNSSNIAKSIFSQKMIDS